MRDTLRVARFYFALLALFTIGRWAQSLGRVEYARAQHVFSIVILTLLASTYFAAFCRRWRGYGLLQSVLLGMTLGLHTFFNHPTALNATGELPFNEALVRRAQGLVAGPITNGVAAFIGWLLGGLLPDKTPRPAA